MIKMIDSLLLESNTIYNAAADEASYYDEQELPKPSFDTDIIPLILMMHI